MTWGMGEKRERRMDDSELYTWMNELVNKESGMVCRGWNWAGRNHEDIMLNLKCNKKSL